MDLVSNGEEGFWYVEFLDYDVIIFDIMFLEIDGLIVLKKI